jgi:hypothetical protein
MNCRIFGESVRRTFIPPGSADIPRHLREEFCFDADTADDA